MSFLDQRERNAAGAEQLVVEFSQSEFAAEASLLLITQTVDDRPADRVAHGDRRRLAVPIQVAAGLLAREV